MGNKIANPITENYPSVGVSQAFYNKSLKDGYSKAAWGNSYQTTQLEGNRLFQHILNGGAWTPGIFEGNRRTENWQAAFTIALDYDNNTSVADALSNPFIKEYAALVHPSASSNPTHYKTRVIFILDEPITDHPLRYTALVQAIIEHIGLHADEASAKAAQAFFGSDNRIEEPYINESARLPLKLIGSLTQPLAIREEAEHLHRAKLQAERATFTEPPRERAEAYARAAYENTLDQLAQSSKGGRNNALFKAAISLWGRALGGWPYHDIGRIESDLSLIGMGLGLEPHEIQATLISARRSASPQTLELPDQPAWKGKEKDTSKRLHQTQDFSIFQPDKNIKTRYMSEVLDQLTARTIALKSPLNTGKTEAMIRLIQQRDIKRVLFITHLKALTYNQTERLRKAGIDVVHYTDNLPIYQADKVVCSVNSLDILANAPAFDLIILDEATQSLPAIYARTLQSTEAMAAYKTLTNLVQSAGQVIALDAHMSDLEADILREWRGDCVSIENTYQHDWGKLTLFDNFAAVVGKAQNLADKNKGVVVLPTNSRNYARRLYHLFSERYGAEQVRSIHGWNSQEPDTINFMTHINERLANDGLRVLIVSPTVATGIDITTPVAGVFGLFTSQPLTATDMLQMMGRFRNARHRAAALIGGERHLETDPHALIQQSEELQATLARRVQYYDGQLAEQNHLNHLEQRYIAFHNRLKNDPRAAFIALATHQGFKLKISHAKPPKRHQEALRNAAKALKEADDALTLTLAPLNREEFDSKSRSGQLKEQDYLAYKRWLIEDTTGQAIRPKLLKRYDTPKQRKALVHFERLYQKPDFEQLIAIDRLEAARELATRRGNNTLWADLLMAALFYLFGEAGWNSEETFYKAEFARRAAQFVAAHGEQVKALEGRNDLSADPTFVIRRVLSHFGLKIKSKRAYNPETGKLDYLYGLDREAFALLIEDTLLRRRYLAAKAEQTFQNADIDLLYHVLEKPVSSEQKRPPPDPQAPLKPD